MPPRFGCLDLNNWAKSIPTIEGYGTEPLTLKGARIVEAHMEIEDDPADALLPKTMHPAVPAYAIFNVTSYPESPFGPFAIAEIRIAGRTGVRPRGHVLRSYVNNEAAAKELAARWGYPVAAGEVSVVLRHDRVIGRASVGGKTVLEIEEIDRDSISGGDIQYIASMHLSRNKGDGKPVLVQVDPEYVFARAERGRPRVVTLDAAAFRADGHLRVTWPIAATYAVADVTLPRLRYVCNPELPALQGTTKVAA